MQKLLLISLFLFSLFNIGCKFKDSEPELRDPIYLDFLKEVADREKELMTITKQEQMTQQELNEAGVRTVDRSIKVKQLEAVQTHIRILREEMEYYRVRAELRKAYARRDYAIAFEKDEEWPKPEEYEAYKLNKRLREAPRDWDDRVPQPSTLSGEAKEAQKQ